MNDTKELLLQIHYYLKEDKIHNVNAFLHNKYESYLLHEIQEISKITGYKDFEVKLYPSQEGGWIDNLKINLLSTTTATAFSLILGAYLSHKYAPAVSKNEDSKNLIEAATALKNGNFTKEEAEILTEDNERLAKFASCYYKNVQKDDSITKIETTLTDSSTQRQFVNNVIERKDFDSHIISNNEKVTDKILSTTIIVISPVLVNIKSVKWKGKYNGENITFTIKDNDFITQVMNREVKFDAGTTLTCDLIIDQKITTFGNRQKIKYTYTVSKVHSWADGSHLQIGNKKYENIKK
ncbi:hypothetical protein [Xylanibacter rarus]|uniref:hypothetical protein n=1 Tax=Xylanibacter rarus TaxID=1676614 RepID=UPI00266CB8BB